MDFIAPLLLILGGILAISGLIVAYQPQAKAVLDKLAPFQAVIGVALLVVGVLNLVRSLGSLRLLFHAPLLGASILAISVCSILLGILFGMPHLAKLSQGGAQQAMEMMRKIMPFQMIIGLIGIGSALVFLVYRLGLMTPGY